MLFRGDRKQPPHWCSVETVRLQIRRRANGHAKALPKRKWRTIQRVTNKRCSADSLVDRILFHVDAASCLFIPMYVIRPFRPQGVART